MTLERLAINLMPHYSAFATQCGQLPNILIVKDTYWLRHFDNEIMAKKFMGVDIIISENLPNDFSFAYAEITPK
jgi:hypothetical protein